MSILCEGDRASDSSGSACLVLRANVTVAEYLDVAEVDGKLYLSRCKVRVAVLMSVSVSHERASSASFFNKEV